jgi:ribosomal protein L15
MRARQGGKVPQLFEGGQATLALRVRKYGFSNKTFKKVRVAWERGEAGSGVWNGVECG